MGYETRLIVGYSNDSMKDNKSGLEYLASLADFRLGGTDVFNDTYLDVKNPGKRAFIYAGDGDTMITHDEYDHPLYLSDADKVLQLLKKSKTDKCSAAAAYLANLIERNKGYYNLYCVLYGY